MYKQAQLLADAVRHLEFATTKFYEVPAYKDIAEELEAIKIKVYERMGLIKETEVKEEEIRDDGLIKAAQEEQEEVEEQPGNGKDPVIWITEKVGYLYDEEKDEFAIVRKDVIGYTTLKRLPRSTLMEIWEKLPERSTEFELRQVMNELGVRAKAFAQYIMRIFTHATFGGDLRIDGKKLILVKPEDFSIYEDLKNQLRAERELIDSGWGK
ncbi:hypothetical protein [Archaeoglobus profundus]|uniref:Uncharacterized protein n=1 Tax=Archaeoglobus profundus (strain DSM 5631 / JCM 9629 / NBRC 100127 / Av18) TaxID=572546 RepID=D2REM5_ARCPA|nr:hypothetical protein [Archaeoglobus profundus]ADB58569.1 hypothetical protein Arcpr_1523 [Archaeoglobus profundus DSM 5631]